MLILGRNTGQGFWVQDIGYFIVASVNKHSTMFYWHCEGQDTFTQFVLGRGESKEFVNKGVSCQIYLTKSKQQKHCSVGIQTPTPQRILRGELCKGNELAFVDQKLIEALNE